MKKIYNLPNLITLIRILCAVCLVFLDSFSVEFFAVYTFAGITDILDGFIARKMNLTSEFGAKLDSVSDLLFYGIMLIKIMPQLLKRVSLAIWIVVGIILIIRLSAYILAMVKYGCFSSLHTILNKLTGFAVFCVPYAYVTSYMTAFCVVVCIIGFASSTEELFTHLKRIKYRSDVKSIFEKE